jgi:hypothetical protein
MTDLADRMVDLVWHVVATCGRRGQEEATAWRVLRDNFTPATTDDVHGRAVRSRMVAALRAEFGAAAEAPVNRARVRDEMAIRRSSTTRGPGERVGEPR